MTQPDRIPETTTSRPAPAAPDVGTRAARGGSVLLVRHAVAFGVNSVGGIVLARWLGPTSLGLYFAAYTLFVIGRQFVDFCTTPHLIRQTRPIESYARYLWLQRTLALALVGATLAVVASGGGRFLSPEHGREFAILLLAAAVGAAAYAWQSMPVARLERGLDYGRIGWIEVLEPVSFNTVAIALVLAGGSVWALAAALVLRGVVPALVAQRAAPLPAASFPGFRALRTLAGELVPLVGAQTTLWAILVAPVVVVGKLAGPEQLGYAQLAYSLLGSVGIPAAVFQRVAFAALARMQDEPQRFERAVRRSLALLATAYVPLLCTLAGFALLWVPRICGPAWTPMARVVLVAALPVTLAGLLSLLYTAVLAHGLNRLVLRQNLLHAAVYWVAILALARPCGALAVPLAHLLALPAGIVYLRAFEARHGRLRVPGVVAGVAGGTAIGAGCWLLVAGGHAALALALWAVCSAAVGPWLWRRLGFASLLGGAIKGEPVEVPGL